MHRHDVIARIAAVGVVGIARARDRAAGEAAARALVDAGLAVVEVSTTTPGALDIVAAMTGVAGDEPASGSGPAPLIGVGTVLDATTARLAALAGASFVVAPSLSEDVVRTAHRYGLVAIPGAGTPTEALAAVEAGADLVKLFPASAYGPASVRDLLAALPQVPLVPTGGVTLDDAADYIAAGAVAVGIGSALTAGTPEEARDRVRELLARIDAIRGDRQ